MIGAVAVAAFVMLLGSRLRAGLAVTRQVRVVAPKRRRRRQRDVSPAELASYLDALAGDVRSGSSLGAAAVAAGATQAPSTTLAIVGVRVASGVALVEALAQVGELTTAEAIVVQSMACASSVGGPVASTLDAAASVLRERDAVDADARVHSAQARLSARVLTAVPVGFAGWSVLSSASARHAYVASPVGIASVLIGLAVNVVGWWWMRRIILAVR